MNNRTKRVPQYSWRVDFEDGHSYATVASGIGLVVDFHEGGKQDHGSIVSVVRKEAYCPDAN